MGCTHNFQYSQGFFFCSKCGKKVREGNDKRKQKRNKITGISLVVSVGLIVFLFFNGVLDFNQNDVNKSIGDITKEISQIGELPTQIKEQSNDIVKKLENDAIQQEREQNISDEEYLKEITLTIHDKINNERTSRGLPSLTWDVQLAQASLNHSNDMANRNYYAHYSPEGNDFTDRYYQVGLVCSNKQGNTIYVGAENIMYLDGYYGLDMIVSETVNGWMNSPGHRENILTPHFKSQGMGVSISGSEVYITEDFC
jgi:uncharacterized protein YkwD